LTKLHITIHMERSALSYANHIRDLAILRILDVILECV